MLSPKFLARRFAGFALATLVALAPAMFPPPVARAGEFADSGSLSTVTRVIDGALGGSVTNGRWTIRMAPGTFLGIGTVSLGVTSATAASCELGIAPASLNRFLVPATLVAQFPSGTNLKGAVIERFDPASGRWQAVTGSRVDAARGQVSAPLQHFSSYRVKGKSGW